MKSLFRLQPTQKNTYSHLYTPVKIEPLINNTLNTKLNHQLIEMELKMIRKSFFTPLTYRCYPVNVYQIGYWQ